jgi:hypothetical protein
MPNLLVTATTRYDPKGLNQAKKHISAFDKTVKTLGKTFAGVFAAQKVLSYGKASVRAFAADEKAARSLSNTLKNVGAQYAATNVEDYIAKLQSATGVLDDNLRPALQILLTATGDVTKSQDALNLALDISANTGKDLSAVSTALAKGFQGNTTALAKMGGAVSKATLATGDMNKITAELTAKYKGSALTAIGGYSGQMAKLGVASANAKEIIGKGLLDSISMLGGTNGVTTTADAMERLAQNTADTIRGFTVLAEKLKAFKLISAIFRTLGDSFSAGPLGSVMRMGQSKVKNGYGQQSPGERAAAVAFNKKLQDQKKQEYLDLMAKNKATKEEAQMKKDQAALDALKAKFDLERIGLNAALNQATDEETKARIKAQIAILDETGKTAQAANDALVKAQKEKVDAEIKAGDALAYLATQAGKASGGIITWLSALEYSKERFGNAGATKPFVGGIPVIPVDNSGAIGATNGGTTTDSQNAAKYPVIPATNLEPVPPYVQGSGAGAGAGEGQVPAAAISVVVNTGPSMADENTIVDAVQNALNEIARRGYLTTYAGALPA